MRPVGWCRRGLEIKTGAGARHGEIGRMAYLQQKSVESAVGGRLEANEAVLAPVVGSEVLDG